MTTTATTIHEPVYPTLSDLTELVIEMKDETNSTLTQIDGYEVFAYTGDYDPDSLSLYYGHMTPVQGNQAHIPEDAPRFIMPHPLSGSDFAGSSYTRANYNSFLSSYGDLPGIHQVYGGHGTYAIVISLEAYQVALDGDDDDTYADMLDTLRALEDYPVIDEEEMSRVEQGWQDEAWDDWACNDYLKALSSVWGLEFLSVDTGVVRLVFEITADSIGEYWESEGSSCYIRVERVAAATDYSEIQEWIDWQWSESYEDEDEDDEVPAA